jgi:hypothetical protein
MGVLEAGCVVEVGVRDVDVLPDEEDAWEDGKHCE